MDPLVFDACLLYRLAGRGVNFAPKSQVCCRAAPMRRGHLVAGAKFGLPRRKGAGSVKRTMSQRLGELYPVDGCHRFLAHAFVFRVRTALA